MKSALLLIAILLLLAIVVVAQDMPTVDNWCDAGGVWDDGRCNDGDEYQQEWHWTCGWYMAQVDKGMFTIEDLEQNVAFCDSLFPPESLPEPSQSTKKPSTTNPPPCSDPDDTDCDGLPDAWELYYFANLSQKSTDDPDGDGCDNLCEYIMGSLPIDIVDTDV